MDISSRVPAHERGAAVPPLLELPEDRAGLGSLREVAYQDTWFQTPSQGLFIGLEPSAACGLPGLAPLPGPSGLHVISIMRSIAPRVADHASRAEVRQTSLGALTAAGELTYITVTAPGCFACRAHSFGVDHVGHRATGRRIGREYAFARR